MSLDDGIIPAFKILALILVGLLALPFIWLALVFMSASPDEDSPYTIRCHNSKEDSYVITDDTLMRLSALEIYEHLATTDKLNLLPKGAGRQTLYHMYLNSESDIRFSASYTGFDPRTFYIYVSYVIAEEPVHFRLNYQDCGSVQVS